MGPKHQLEPPNIIAKKKKKKISLYVIVLTISYLIYLVQYYLDSLLPNNS